MDREAKKNYIYSKKVDYLTSNQYCKALSIRLHSSTDEQINEEFCQLITKDINDLELKIIRLKKLLE